MRLLKAAGRETGATRFELMVVAMVFGVVAAIILDRVRYYQEFAEKTVMEMTVVNIRSGLRYRMAELALQSRTGEFSRLVQENPVRWLVRPPQHYLGELVDPQASEIQPGSWYYDKSRRQLVYRINQGRYFEADEESKKFIRYQVIAIAGQARTGAVVAPVEWVALKLVEPYQWF